MAFVIRRRDGRFEIRETVSTPDGPRARTLATFRTLDPATLKTAATRSQRPFDSARLTARARELGAPVHSNDSDHHARALVAACRDGAPPAPVLRALLGTTCAVPPVDAVPPHLYAARDWVGVDDRERGATLRDLLGVVDHLPVRPAGALEYPTRTARARS